MIPLAFIVLTCFVSFFVTLRRGPGATFSYVLLPVTLLLFTVTALEIQKLPDVTTVAAVSYGTLAGLIVRGWKPPFRLSLIDLLVVTLAALRVVSGTVNGQLWTGVSLIGQQVLMVLTPYVLARTAFIDRYYRGQSAKVLIGLALLLLPAAMIEWRLRPLFYARAILEPLDLTNVNWELVQHRYGFFRAQVSFCHPIDLGNGAALLAVLIVVLSTASGWRLKDKWVAAGIAAALIMSLTSMSFTSFVAVGAIGVLYVLLRWVPRSEILLLPIAVASIIGYGMLTKHFVDTEPERVVWQYDEQEDSHSGSLYIRHLIVYNTWGGSRGTRDAGLLGYGEDHFDPMRSYGLLSIDNSYVVFVLENGWGYLGLFLLIALLVTAQSTIALMRVPPGTSRIPLAAATAGLIGTMFGMYTVFFGFVYAQLFWLLLGLTASLLREVAEKTGKAAPVQLEANREAEAEHRREGLGAFA